MFRVEKCRGGNRDTADCWHDPWRIPTHTENSMTGQGQQIMVMAQGEPTPGLEFRWNLLSDSTACQPIIIRKVATSGAWAIGCTLFLFCPEKRTSRNHARVIIAEAQHPGNSWQELYNAAIVEFDLAKLPERVEAACDAIHQYRVRKQALSAAERNELDEALRAFKLMQRAA